MTDPNYLPSDQEAMDAALLARCVEGDQDAFRELYDRYIELVLNIGMRICRQHSDANEIASVVFVEIWKHPNRFRPERGSFRTYIGLLTRSRAKDHMRRSATAAKNRRQLQSDRRAETEATQRESDPAEQSSDAELQTQISEKMALLPVELNVPLTMSFYDGLSHREIAKVLNLPLGTVKSRCRRALKLLGSQMRTTSDLRSDPMNH